MASVLSVRSSFLFLGLMFCFCLINATVSEYTFSSSIGNYQEISGGTIHGSIPSLDNESFLDIPLGFTFSYNGVNYTSVSINSNGFMAMGPVVSNNFLAISSSTGTNNIIAAMNRDLIGKDTGQLMSLTTGTAPNRVFTVQWKNYRRIPAATLNDELNFQIKLFENTNQINIIYGSIVAATSTTAQNIQVGLRGNSNADFNNRMTVDPHNWSTTSTGSASNSSCRLSATTYPAVGLTFTWMPPSQNPFGSISGKLFHDLNYNGVFDNGEPPLDFEVTLIGETNQSVFPDPYGIYQFPDLPVGHYQVGVVIPPSWTIMNVDYTGKKHINLVSQQHSVGNNFAIFNLVRPTDGPEQIFINGFNTGLSNSERPGSPTAPQQSAPISPTSRLYNSIYITASRSGFEPDTLYIRKNQIVPMYMTSVDNLTHVLLFNDPALSAVAIGVGPNETRAIYWKAYNVVPGQSYGFRCDVPGHSAGGELGVFHVLSSEYPEIEINNPASGDTLYIGEQYQVNWTSSGHGFVLVQLSINNGQTWLPLHSSPIDAQAGQHTFQVPDMISSQSKIRIIDTDYQHVYAVSDGMFTIVPHSMDPKIQGTPSPVTLESVIFTNTTPQYEVQLVNLGYENLVIDSWSISGNPSWFNVSLAQPGIALGHLESTMLTIDCTPQAIGGYSSILYIYSNCTTNPTLAIPIYGVCAYIPPNAPQNVNVQLDHPDLLITWNSVTQDIYGNHITPSYYFVYGSNVPNPSPENLVFLGYSINPSFRHLGVNLPGANIVPPSEMFYRIVAVIWYPRGDELVRLNQMIGKSSYKGIREMFDLSGLLD